MPAQQGTAADLVAARRHFERGMDFSGRARWRDAEREFAAAWALSHRPSSAFNLATVRYRLGDYVAALRALDGYSASADPAHNHQAEARRLEVMLEGLVARVSLEVAPAVARVLVDGAEQPGRGPHRHLLVDPGAHTIAVTARRHVTTAERVTLAAGVALPLAITLARAPDPPRAGPAIELGGRQGPGPLERGPAVEDSSILRWVALGAGAAGALGLVASGAFTLSALSRYRAANDACDGNLCSPEGHETRESARTLGDAATVAAVAGGALLAGGLALYLSLELGEDTPPLQVGATLRPDLVGIRFAGQL